MNRNAERLVKVLLFVATSALVPGALSGELPVYILAGQSNMVGHGKLEEGKDPNGGKANVNGGIGSLRRFVRDHPELYGAKGKTPLVDEKGVWLVRDDVYLTTTVEDNDNIVMGPLKARDHFGPEFAFGHVIGNATEGPVLIIKTSWGGKSLAINFRPPSSGKPSFGKNPEAVGVIYRKMMTTIKAGLAHFETDYPQLKGYTPRIAGFGWHQGWNDGCSDEAVKEYEKNMANFIQDVRKELGVEKLPFVIANTGMIGLEATGRRKDLCEIQMALGDPEKHPEFAGTVASVETRGFARKSDQSPSNFGYHWNHNGESHFLIGEAMAEAMLKLEVPIAKEAAPASQ